ncbi:hypothetical protein [Rhizobium rhizogenes]|uniref:hypothetical protein n=1 Tax=Rhizobium rhizogenes TaxID=359 RepID=UPI0004DAFBAB|nr:hypothetical protein [Rhizobium rhizogenes]KEA07515.1 hypothetical protein CN09_11495 [Rhizobium rhizogenes]NTJ22205.1 hypothetical protein [Rhizobium rhizogenes]QUE80924.1 hypothetical protein EML492_03695 [Rhizobium rhizogenes]TQO80969.1 hypothetical protein FFE80_07705 [Rhizobium rhizogenes]TRB51563.1 hypothetical protein EXN69_26590 [Rhizobium rhizogenes]
MTLLPPLTGTPLDYVPIDAPIRNTRPTVFTAPIIRRSLVAAITAAAFVAAFFFPSIGVGAIALAMMYGFVWAGNKLGDWLNERETHATSTPASWWPDPFSWVPAILALVFIAAVIYFH